MQVGFFFSSDSNFTQILTPFSEKFSDFERTYNFFQQDSKTGHTANNSM
jgi:hypothetical protein